MLKLRFLALCAAVLLLAGHAQAAPVFPTLLTIEQVGAGTQTIDSDMAACSGGSGSYSCQGSDLWNAEYGWELDWDLSLSTNPSVSSAFGFTNSSGSTQTYVITVQIPVSVVGPASLIGGSFGGSVTDSSNDGTGGLTTSSPDALFEGLIDGGNALSIYPDPQAFNFIFAGQTITIPAQNPGLPGPTLPGPAVAATIGVRNTFTLTDGDSVSMTSFFDVEPIPEPGTGLLLGLGLTLLAGRRAKRA